MGYGFCLPNNPADRFGLCFNQAMTTHIKETRAQRQSPQQGNDQDAHWVRLTADQPLDPDHGCGPLYQFSPGFLEDFSIAVESDRERRMANTEWARFQKDFSGTGISRNMLQVLCLTIILYVHRVKKHSSFPLFETSRISPRLILKPQTQTPNQPTRHP